MEGKILGIPLVLIVLVVLMLAPLLGADVLLSRQLSHTQVSCSKPEAVVSTTPTATPSASVTVSPSPKVFKGAGAGLVK